MQFCTLNLLGERESESPMLRSEVEARGFAIIPGVLPEAEIAQLADAVAKAVPGRTRAGARHLLGNAAIARLARSPRLVALATEILGPPAFPFGATLFAKSPWANWLVMWHQDTALPVRQRRSKPGWGPWSVKAGVLYAHAPAAALSDLVALRMHLDDSTDTNGPLRVLPGSHSLGVMSDQAIAELKNNMPPVDCLVPRGGVVAMRPLLVHSSSKSTTRAARRVIHIEYTASSVVDDNVELDVAQQADAADKALL